MLTKSIIASLLVLGTSSVALAAPCEPTPAPVAQPIAQPTVQATVYPRYPQAPEYPTKRPITRPIGHGPVIIRPNPIAFESAPMFLQATQYGIANLGARDGRIGQLELHVTGGATVVQKVIVQFTNGTQQLVRLNQTINADHNDVRIDIHDGAVKQVLLKGQSYGAGGVELEALRA